VLAPPRSLTRMDRQGKLDSCPAKMYRVITWQINWNAINLFSMLGRVIYKSINGQLMYLWWYCWYFCQNRNLRNGLHFRHSWHIECTHERRRGMGSGAVFSLSCVHRCGSSPNLETHSLYIRAVMQIRNGFLYNGARWFFSKKIREM
jgi:hypothetical protein